MSNVLYVGDKSGAIEIVYDAPTGLITLDIGSVTVGGNVLQITGMAWDPVGNVLYAVTTSNDPFHPKALLTIDPLDATLSTFVGNLGTTKAMTDITCSSGGQLYGWLAGGGGLYSINKSTGHATAIGTENIFAGGLAFVGSTLYYLADGTGNDIYTVNTGTGVATDTGVTMSSAPFALEAAEYHEGVMYGGGSNDFYCDINLGTGVGGAVSFVTVEATNMQALASVPAAFAPPPPTPPPTPNIGTPKFEWRFVVAKLNQRVLSWLTPVATQQSVTYELNKPAIATGVVPSDNPAVNLIQSDGFPILEEGVRILWGLRRLNPGPSEPWIIAFAGILMQVEDNVDEASGVAPYTTYTAYDPRQLLYTRPVRNADGSFPTGSGQKWTAEHGDTIVKTLLARTKTYDGEHYIYDNLSGGNTDVMDITFQPGTSVGEALDQINAAGNCDILFTPLIFPGSSFGNAIVSLEIFKIAGYNNDGTPDVKYKAPLAWDMPRRNITAANRLKDGTQRANRIQYYYGTNVTAVGEQSNIPAAALYGNYWAQQSFQGATKTEAEALAAEQAVIRGKGPVTYKFNLAPGALGQVNAPIFEPGGGYDYRLGTILPIYASGRFRKPIRIGKRVTRIPITIADNGIETIQQIEFGEGELALQDPSEVESPFAGHAAGSDSQNHFFFKDF